MRKSSPADNRVARGTDEDEFGVSKTAIGLVLIAVALVILSAFKIRSTKS